MTDEQKFLFDLNGWIVIPDVLPRAQIDEIKQYLFTIRDDPDSLAPEFCNPYAGPPGELLDHPVVVDILSEVIREDVSETAYGFRCDNSFAQIRGVGEGVFSPHGGPSDDLTHIFQFHNGRMISPATRVVWELNAVPKSGGGTFFMSGSHKSNFAVPKSLLAAPNDFFETYDCPPGSAVVFSESVMHSAVPWTGADEPRVAVFTHYTHFGTRTHRTPTPHGAVMAMPPKRQSLFRDVWEYEFPPEGPRINAEYSEENRAR